MRGYVQGWALLFATGAICASSAAATEFSSLEERMSQADFKASGLQKLSPQELEHLDAWLKAHGVTGAAGAAAAKAGGTEEGFRPKGFFGSGSDNGPIHAHIKGTISGWSGHTMFELDNGQAWQQTDGTEFSMKSMTDPAVTIEQGLMGSWMLKVEGYNHSARVTRVR